MDIRQNVNKDIGQNVKKQRGVRARELCERRGDRPGSQTVLMVSGREATLNLNRERWREVNYRMTDIIFPAAATDRPAIVAAARVKLNSASPVVHYITLRVGRVVSLSLRVVRVNVCQLLRTGCGVQER